MNEDLLFPTLSPEQVSCLLPFGRAVSLEPDETLFQEGDPETEFYIVRAGELRITKMAAGAVTTLRVHRPGEFTGAMSLFNGGTCIATARALSACRLLGVDRDGFGRILAACPDVAETILFAMAERRPEAEVMTRQREKLAALGKFSAGLAHELNNPAAAARRAAADLRETLRRLQTLTLSLAGLRLTPDDRAWLSAFPARVTKCEPSAVSDDPLARCDAEDEVGDWLDAHGVPDGWELAPTLAEMGLDAAGLDDLAGRAGEDALPDTLAWLAASVSADALARQVEGSAARISDLVGAIKSYSYMDQAPTQDVDVHEGLDSTLMMLGHALKNITIKKDYDRSLPRFPAFGSELNQVWTNLIDNAADAMDGRGTLTVRTAREGESVLVEIADDGPGIAEDIQSRIFEPFFTTKPMGEGSGLGLDISYRIVTERHHGELCVESRPGDTRFQVRLPLSPESVSSKSDRSPLAPNSGGT